ncbi:ABC transporter ATP-binding protein [soil metagenome]
MVGSPVLSAERLQHSYGGRRVLDIDRIDVRAGEVLAVVGPNGAGKSTLFRLLLLLERADAGTIRVDGDVVTIGDRGVRRRLAGVFQRPVMFTGTVADNVGFGLRARGVRGPERARRVTAALGWLGLERLAGAPVHTLSGGEAQRVALVRALVVQPDVLLLDEPPSSLDVAVRRRFRMDLERVARQHARAIVLVTHDAAEAFGLADRVLVLHDGRAVQTGTPDEIMLRPGSPFVSELSGAELLLHVRVDAVDAGLISVRAGAGTRLWATSSDAALEVGADVVVAYRPEDVTLTPAAAGPATSAMNRLDGRITAVVSTGALTRVRVDCDDVALTALVTGRSAEALGLVAGERVIAHIKATALHVWQRETHP